MNGMVRVVRLSRSDMFALSVCFWIWWLLTGYGFEFDEVAEYVFPLVMVGRGLKMDSDLLKEGRTKD